MPFLVKSWCKKLYRAAKGHTLSIGSELGGFKIVAITSNTVHLEGPDGKMILFLNQSIFIYTSSYDNLWKSQQN